MIPPLSVADPAVPARARETPAFAADGPDGATAAASGVHVSISPMGRQAAREDLGGRTAAAGPAPGEEAPALPVGVREALERLREIRQRLEQAIAELQRVMNDRRMAPDAREARVTALRTEIATLHGALQIASQALLDAMKTAELDLEQSAAVVAAL